MSDFKKTISKEGSDIMTDANRIMNFLDKQIKKCDERLEEFNRTDMERDFKRAYGQWQILVSLMQATMIKANALAQAITTHAETIEKTLRKIPDEKDF